MTTTSNVLYASQARPWLKYYDPDYIDQPMPECSAFDFVRQQNKNRLSETALEYYGRKFTYADFIVNTKKTAAAFRAAGVRKGDIITVVSVMTPEVIYAFYAAEDGDNTSPDKIFIGDVVPQGSYVTMLGSNVRLKWKKGSDGVYVNIPESLRKIAPCDYVFCLKIKV